MRHIGIIAISPEGSALCYRLLGKRAGEVAEPERRPIITLHSLPFNDFLEAVERNEWECIADMLVTAAETLHRAGAAFCILPDNLASHAAPMARIASPIPWLSMTRLVADAVVGHKRTCIGLIGTRHVMQGSIYQTILGLKGVRVLTPDDEHAEAVDRIIFDELVHGRVESASRRRVLEVIQRLAGRGCEGVILGSTETPLLVTPGFSPLPTYDPVELLVDGALKVATGQDIIHDE